MSDAEIIEAIVDNMMLLAEVPRPSHHEEKISAFLMQWAKEQGFEPLQDGVNNVMFEIPATEGMEELPLTILQGHMDMVAVGEEGKDFDPLTDSITVIRDDEKGILTADGTSLGADDGIGLSIIMATSSGKMAHGPLRVIITVNEEDGMDGANNLDPAWLDGASTLIDIDNEDASQLLVSTASADTVTNTKQLDYSAPSGDKALHLRISNLKGGHSGLEIDKGRLNGIIGLVGFLNRLDEEDIAYELASFRGGTAHNAIPPQAAEDIVINSEKQDQIMQMLAAYCDELNEQYKGVEDDIQCEATETDDLPKVIFAKDKESVIRLINETFTGVYTMSKDMEGLVESSANLGVFTLGPKEATALISVRSSDPEQREKILDAQKKLAQECGFETIINSFTDAWKYDPDSRLIALAKKCIWNRTVRK